MKGTVALHHKTPTMSVLLGVGVFKQVPARQHSPIFIPGVHSLKESHAHDGWGCVPIGRLLLLWRGNLTTKLLTLA